MHPGKQNGQQHLILDVFDAGEADGRTHQHRVAPAPPHRGRRQDRVHPKGGHSQTRQRQKVSHEIDSIRSQRKI